MLLNQIFKQTGPTEIVIVRKDGNLLYQTRPLSQETDNDQSDKPMFPISKDRS